MKIGKFASNSGWDILQQLYISAVGFLIGLVSARYLGPDHYGEIAVVSSVIALMSAVAGMGFDSILVHELVIDPEKEEEMVGMAILTRTVLSAVLLPLFYAAVVLIYHSTTINVIFWILGIGMLFQSHEFYRLWMQSRMLMKYHSIAMIAVTTVTAAYQIFLLVTQKNVFWFAAVQLIQNVLLFLLLGATYRARFGKRLRMAKDVFLRMFSKGHHFILSSIAITLYMQIDKVMIGKMLSSTQAGCYTAAVNIGELWRFLPLALIGAAKPFLFAYHKEDRERSREHLEHLIFLTSLLMLAICLGITFLAPLIVRILYGADYMDAVPPLQLTTWATFFSMIGVMRSIWIVANEYERFDKYFTVSAGVLNIILNYFLIRSMGITGAALATLISYFYETVLVNLLFRETRGFNTILLHSFRNGKRSLAFLSQKLHRRSS